MEYTTAGFVQLVQKMRSAQKEYFSTRSRHSLQNSKELETQVDHYAAKLEDKLKERGMA
jgi:hypothetical protein